MAEPGPKRIKITRGEDDYMPGNITEIELHNFMTFSQLKCKPGSRLNLVIGPNGSGKSSLVCAIALGLGGEPQLLGRASSIGAFVKRGEDNGYIKISLRGDTKEEVITIMRKIDAKNKSEWLFNGKVVPKKHVLEIIQRYNIQVNNLTQFLPQDRVCEFAKLTPVQLLEETEKAVGDPRLPVMHSSLITKSEELKRLERTIQSSKETLDQLKQANAEIEGDVERFRQRDLLLAKAEQMKMKLPWLQYDLKKVAYKEAKNREKDAKEKVDDAAKTLNELMEPIKKQKQEKAAQDGKCKKLSDLLDNNAEKRMGILERDNFLVVQIRGKYREMEDQRRQEESRQEKLSKALNDLRDAELELANLPSSELPQNKLEGLRTVTFELEVTARELRSQKLEAEKSLERNRTSSRQCQEKLKELENMNNKRLHELRSSGAEKIFEAYRWVKEHHNEFNKDVYGPVAIEVNISSTTHANYLEGHIPFYAWKAFITQDSADRDLLVENLKSFDVPILNYTGVGNGTRQPFQLTEEMRRLGIYSRLDQVFEAPFAVKEVLISQFGLEYSYIGSKETDQRADQISRLGIHDFWTPENHYRWIKSRYGPNVSAMVETVNGSRLLSNMEPGEVDTLKAQKRELDKAAYTLEENLNKIKVELRNTENEGAELERQHERLVNAKIQDKKRRVEMEKLVEQRKLKLKSLERENDLDSTITNLSKQATELKAQRFRCAVQLKDLLTQAAAYRRSYAEQSMASIELEFKIKDMETKVKHQEKLAEEACLHHECCKKKLEDFRDQLSAAMRHAESIALITPELEQAFLEMPSTIEELEAAIQDTVYQANSILCLNPNALEQYETRQRKIDSLSKKHEMDEKELSCHLNEINALKESWLPTLRDLVSQINDTFSRNFREMAVAGEVSLDEHDMDFDKYGILIRVQFRETGKLQILSAHHQSGGERSVSTILYLVSLQDLTTCPFRVVDEINQGMDPINERKMFQQLVRAASQRNTPQCFLLTPKLLPNLDYSDACSVLTVMNGPWIEQASKAWINGESWRSVKGASKERCH
ncbi:structural maintenance of chromosomes protein 5 [Ipomoea triloba]|uniref:structural maintenance of chromosomes protein 5 n=1 Tax=Ipomoea triloba TaxID=35885 RepID=UPI00125D2626|nr:structural maintenance of chromosomes protein 5 [Ipomoea triloba]